MSQHIFTFFRNFRLSRALKSLPLQRFRLVTPEPQSTPAIPQGDVWLFGDPAPVSTHAAALSGEMTRVSDTLSDLHLLVSRISGQACATEPAETAGVSGHIWSDPLLFDGEPAGARAGVYAAEADAFLFDDEDAFGSVEDQDMPPMRVHVPTPVSAHVDTHINP